MKLFVWLIILPILALVIALFCGVPALDWLGFLFKIIAKLFSGVGRCCEKLQDWISWVVH